MRPDHHHADTADLAAPDAAASVHLADLASLGTAGAAPAGLSPPPTNDNARLQAGEVERHGTANITDCAGQARQAQDLSRTDKNRSTLAALLALKGYSLHELADGSYLAAKWNHTRPLRDLHAVQCFARQVGAA